MHYLLQGVLWLNRIGLTDAPWIKNAKSVISVSVCYAHHILQDVIAGGHGKPLI